MRRAWILFLMLYASCSSREPAPVPTVSDYFPLKKGYYQIFAIDSIVVNQNVETPYSYQIRMEVTDSFPSAGSSYTYVIQRAMRADLNSPWTALPSWSARMDGFQLVVNEENVPYVRLSGPLANGKMWNGNAYNNLGGTERCPGGTATTCDVYAIQSFGKSYETLLSQNFANTLMVVENDNQDLISEFDKRLAFYAVKTGLIYREVTHLKYCTSTQDCLGTQFVQKGLRYRQTIMEYGSL